MSTTPTEETDGGPAFPVEVNVFDNNGSHVEQSYGMTLRDYFAAAALQGLIASNFYDRYRHTVGSSQPLEPATRVAASIAFEYADEMLKARLDV